MARTGSYFGGSTIIGPNRHWAAASARRKRKKRLEADIDPMPVNHQTPLLVPLHKVHLIMSVMKDLNRPLPKGVKGVNKALRRLMDDKVILADGEFNRRHPLLQQWMRRIQKVKRAAG